jgi:AcrR family transcriptional regulator
MLAAARELVFASGVTISLEDLSFEEVIQHAGVPRSSVYRIWPYKGDFVDDLLCHMAGPNWFGTAAFDQETLDLAATVVADHQDMLATPEGRRAVLLEAVRQAALQNFRAIVDSQEWHIYVALVATARSTHDDEARERIEKALGASEEAFITKMAEFYEAMGQVLGRRLRKPEYSYHHVASAGAALVEGLALRQVLAQTLKSAPDNRKPHDRGFSLNELLNSPLPGPGIDGKPADWSLPALAFMAIVDSFTEPDPNYQPGP